MDKFGELYIPDSWKTGGGPGCCNNGFKMGCKPFMPCSKCILIAENVNVFLDWQKTFKEPEPEYPYEVKVENTVFGQKYLSFGGHICHRIDIGKRANAGEIWFAVADSRHTFYIDGKSKILSSTDPNTCTVGDLGDLKKAKLLNGQIFHRINLTPTPLKVNNNFVHIRYENNQHEWIDKDTPCTRIPDPKGDTDED